MDGELTPAEFKTYWRTFLQAVPDLWVDILSITTEGDTSMQCWRARGTHLGNGLGIPPSGRPVDVSGASFYQFGGVTTQKTRSRREPALTNLWRRSPR